MAREIAEKYGAEDTLWKKDTKINEGRTNKKAPKAEKLIILFSALGTFANFRHLSF
jgi:hypothetical protein